MFDILGLSGLYQEKGSIKSSFRQTRYDRVFRDALDRF
jgi:hypothetical protein